MTGTVLDRILAHKQGEIVERRRRTPLADLRSCCRERKTCRGFQAALEDRVRSGAAAVIAEIKKASPSKGIIRNPFDPEAIALSYAEGGATCLSILTDEHFFQGSDHYLTDVRKVVSLPLLRKDFTLDAYQIYEARCLGADAILLIAAVLQDERLGEFYQLAQELTLDILVEVHNEVELSRALKLKPTLLGINNRNLHTFETRLETTLELLPEIPKEVTLVTESGIRSRADIARMREHGVNAFLVGEACMREDDPGHALRALITA